MHPGLEKRLKRLAADLMQAENAALAHRRMLRSRVAFGTRLREMLAARGVDPAEIVMLRVVDEAAAELAAMPTRDDDAADGPAGNGDWRAAADLYRRITRLALLHFADGERPGRGSSLMEWHAWCLVNPASPHHPNILLDPEVQLYQRMLRLGSGDPRWR